MALFGPAAGETLVATMHVVTVRPTIVFILASALGQWGSFSVAGAILLGMRSFGLVGSSRRAMIMFCSANCLVRALLVAARSAMS
jgi:hypothetical protein